MAAHQEIDRRILQILSLLSQPLPIGFLERIKEVMRNGGEFDVLADLSVDEWREHLQRLANQKDVHIFQDKHQESQCVRISSTRRNAVRDEFLTDNAPLAKDVANSLFNLFVSERDFREKRDTAVLGCLAGKFNEAFDARYSKYARRGGLPRTLAADRASELEAVRMFFEDDWSIPRSVLSENEVVVLWHHVGICLRGLGKHSAADPLFQATLEQCRHSNDYRRAAMCSNHMVVSFISQCRMADALVHALAASKFAGEEKKSENRRSTRGQSAIGSVLFKSGHFSDAQKVFEGDELLSVPRDAIAAWRKCTWLSVSGNYKAARNLAHKATIGFSAKEQNQPELGHCLLTLAKANAESHFGPAAFTKYKRDIDDAVNGLETIGLLDDLAHGLLQRAALALRVDPADQVAEADIAKASVVSH